MNTFGKVMLGLLTISATFIVGFFTGATITTVGFVKALQEIFDKKIETALDEENTEEALEYARTSLYIVNEIIQQQPLEKIAKDLKLACVQVALKNLETFKRLHPDYSEVDFDMHLKNLVRMKDTKTAFKAVTNETFEIVGNPSIEDIENIEEYIKQAEEDIKDAAEKTEDVEES